MHLIPLRAFSKGNLKVELNQDRSATGWSSRFSVPRPRESKALPYSEIEMSLLTSAATD